MAEVVTVVIRSDFVFGQGGARQGEGVALGPRPLLASTLDRSRCVRIARIVRSRSFEG
jgi:hypothetical protein